MLRDDIKAATISAMKAGDKPRTAALRLISARIKDRDIELRTSSKEIADDDLVAEVLQKMAKQRRESITMFQQGGRDELAAQEQAELGVIEEFMPKQMDEAETKAAVEAIVAEVGATSVKDMGKVMGALKAKYAGKMDFAKAGAVVKAALG